MNMMLYLFRIMIFQFARLNNQRVTMLVPIYLNLCLFPRVGGSRTEARTASDAWRAVAGGSRAKFCGNCLELCLSMCLSDYLAESI